MNMTTGGRCGFLDILDAQTRRSLLERSRVIRARKGQAVLARGEASRHVLVVQEGQLRATLFSADGREVSLRDLSEGQLVGELAAIDGEERSAGVVALSDCRLLAIADSDFRAAILRSPEASEWLLRRLAAQVRALTSRVFELSALNVRTRLLCELVRVARSDGKRLTPTHAELANRVGTHREAVTRELKALADRKIIRTGRRQLQILDAAGLENALSAGLLAPVGDEGWW